MRRIAGLVLAAAAITGCSQIAQLQPVAGAQISAVRTATNDVLVDSGVPLEVAPVCTYEQPLYICRGTAAGGAQVLARAEVLAPFGATKDEWGADMPADVSLKITVGGQPLYDGKLEDVLLRNGQVDR